MKKLEKIDNKKPANHSAFASWVEKCLKLLSTEKLQKWLIFKIFGKKKSQLANKFFSDSYKNNLRRLKFLYRYFSSNLLNLLTIILFNLSMSHSVIQFSSNQQPIIRNNIFREVENYVRNYFSSSILKKILVMQKIRLVFERVLMTLHLEDYVMMTSLVITLTNDLGTPH